MRVGEEAVVQNLEAFEKKAELHKSHALPVVAFVLQSLRQPDAEVRQFFECMKHVGGDDEIGSVEICVVIANTPQIRANHRSVNFDSRKVTQLQLLESKLSSIANTAIELVDVVLVHGLAFQKWFEERAQHREVLLFVQVMTAEGNEGMSPTSATGVFTAKHLSVKRGGLIEAMLMFLVVFVGRKTCVKYKFKLVTFLVSHQEILSIFRRVCGEDNWRNWR